MEKWMAGILLAVIFGFGALHWALPDAEYSPRERKYLEQAPELNGEDVRSGAFMQDFDDYMEEQFPLRDSWLDIKELAERVQMKKELSGLYFGEGGYLLDALPAGPGRAEENAGHIRSFLERYGGKIAFAPIPTSGWIYADKLPKWALATDQQAMLDSMKIPYADTFAALAAHRDEPLYYKQDHHYTMLGAYWAYTALAAELGIEPQPLENFEEQTVSQSFRGTYYAKAGGFFSPQDAIAAYFPKVPREYTVTIEDTGETHSGLYDFAALEGDDPYSFFLYGNHAAVRIRSGAKNGRKLLLLKDSFAHSMVPFLADHYEEIVMLDLRYFRRDIVAFAQQEHVDGVALVYGMSSLAGEAGLGNLRIGAQQVSKSPGE